MPTSEVLAVSEPTYYREVSWPTFSGQAIGSFNADFGHTRESFGEPRDWINSGESPSFSGTGGTGVTKGWQSRLGLDCARFRLTGGIDLAGEAFRFPWWKPQWELAGVNDGLSAGDPGALVTVFDLWYSFDFDTSDWLSGTTGIFFYPIATSGSYDIEFLPRGSDSRCMFGFEVRNSAAPATTSLSFSTWDDSGARLTQALPSTTGGTTPDPLVWNSARVVIVGATSNAPARIDSASIGGQTVLRNLEFDDSDLFSQSTMVAPADVRAPGIIAAVGDSAQGASFFFRWRMRTGLFLPSGVKVQV